MGKFIPVEPEKWAEMVKAQAEVTRLKAEVERVGAENSHLHKGIYSLSLNVGQLKDEVERLTLLQSETLAERNKAEAQVERLTKAGDAMAFAIDQSFEFPVDTRPEIKDAYLLHHLRIWTAAKKGGQP